MECDCRGGDVDLREGVPLSKIKKIVKNYKMTPAEIRKDNGSYTRDGGELRGDVILCNGCGYGKLKVGWEEGFVLVYNINKSQYYNLLKTKV